MFKKIWVLIFVFNFLMLSSFTYASGNTQESTSNTSKNQSISQKFLGTAKEIFMKGSIDGKHMFMVLGLGDAHEFNQGVLNTAINPEDFVDLGYDIYNSRSSLTDDHGYDHESDMADAVVTGARFARDMAPRILQSPWRTLKDIPGSFEVNLNRASDSYNTTENPALAGLKYSGWAAVALVQGSYYLVVEAPVELLFYSAVTTAAIPTMAAFQTLVITIDALKIGLKVSFGVVVSTAVEAYSLLSTTTAAVLTLAVTGVVYVFRGGTWLFYDLPRKAFFYPVKVNQPVPVAFDQVSVLADQVLDRFKYQIVGQSISRIETKRSRSKVKISLYSDAAGKEEVALLTVRLSHGSVVIIAELSSDLIDRLYREGGKRKKESKIRDELEAELKDVLKTLKNEVTAPRPVVINNPAPVVAPLSPELFPDAPFEVPVAVDSTSSAN